MKKNIAQILKESNLNETADTQKSWSRFRGAWEDYKKDCLKQAVEIGKLLSREGHRGFKVADKPHEVNSGDEFPTVVVPIRFGDSVALVNFNEDRMGVVLKMKLGRIIAGSKDNVRNTRDATQFIIDGLGLEV